MVSGLLLGSHMWWLVLVVVVGGCYPPSPVYRVQRAARVPRPVVPFRTGEPLAGPVELGIGWTAGTTVRAPSHNLAALEIPDHQVRGELRVRVAKRGEIAIVHERGLGPATKLDPTQAEIDDGQPWSAGAAVRYAVQPEGTRWSLGLDTELARWVLPYTELRQCIENCDGVAGSDEIHGLASELTWGLGVSPAYRVGDVTLFGGVSLENHPTIRRKAAESGANQEDLDEGPLNVLVHAGVALRARAFTAMLVISQNTDRAPVLYGPSIGVAVSATIDPGADKIEQTRERVRRRQRMRAAR